MSVLNRAMFRIPGQQSRGIMRSSPELIRASTAKASQLNPIITGAPEFKIGKLRSGITQIPTQKVDIFGNIKAPGGALLDIAGKPKPSYTYDEPSGKDSQYNYETIPYADRPNEPTSDSTSLYTQDKIGSGLDINNVNKKILEKTDDFDANLATETGLIPEDDFDANLATETGAAISDEGSGKASTEPSTEPGPSMLSGFESKQKNLSDRMTKAIANLSTGLADADDIKLGGKTILENSNALVAKLQEKGETPTLADVQDDAIKLLGFDPRELEGEYEEDRKASIFMNMMKAGLAVAAGQSDDAITNIAKGFGVGLQGYGEDVNLLSKQLREDRREARNTMYNLLKDKKSEALAQRTLEIQQMEGVVNIQKSLIGDQRQQAQDIFNQEMTQLKFNANLLSAAAEMGLKEKNLQLTKENIDKTFKAALLRAQPEIISLLKARGHMKLKDGITKEIPYGEENYLEQYELTEFGQKTIDNYLTELKKGTSKSLNSGSEFNVKRKNIATTGQVDIVPTPPNFGNANEEIKESYGIAGTQLLKDLGSLTDPIDRFNRVVSFVRSQKQNFPGIKIPENTLPGAVKQFLNQKKVGKNKGINASDYADVLELSVGD